MPAKTRPEVDFGVTEIEEIATAFVENGCVLLRGFCAPQDLDQLRSRLSALHAAVNAIHIFPDDLCKHGLAAPQDYLFEDKHGALLRYMFQGDQYRDLGGNVSRHIDPSRDRAGWQRPLGPHLDAFVHPLVFTLNFWVPLQPCGRTLPGLGVVCASFEEVLDFVGYQSTPFWEDAANPGLNYGNFRPGMYEMFNRKPEWVASVHARFADGIWTPDFEFGDAMMLSNWTLHFTHVAAGITGRRENVEMRFICEASFGETLQKLRAARGGASLSTAARPPD